jgi:hypothetical protein
MRIFLSALLCTCILFNTACQEEKVGPPRNFISFQLDNKVVLSENPQGLLTAPNLTDNNPDNDYPTLLITGISYQGEMISFTLVSPTNIITPGLYESTKEGNGMTISAEGGVAVLGADNKTGMFSLTITSVTGNVIEGNFSGIIDNLYGGNTPKVLSKGSFRAIYKQL